jgi:alcohol dehydrogenase class IV
VDAGAIIGREAKVDCVIAFGGGSSIDTGKAVAMLLTNGGVSLDYMEVIGKGLAIKKPSLPMIAISTTAGTGAEVTRNAVVNSTAHQQKASLRSNFMYPALAIIDPELTLTVPQGVTAATGLDAFTQCLEPFVSVASNPVTDALSLKVCAHVGRCVGACPKLNSFSHRAWSMAQRDYVLHITTAATLKLAQTWLSVRSWAVSPSRTPSSATCTALRAFWAGF